MKRADTEFGWNRREATLWRRVVPAQSDGRRHAVVVRALGVAADQGHRIFDLA